MHKFFRAVFLISATLAFIALTGLSSVAAEVPRISADELKGVLGSSEIVVLDVRASRDWYNSTKKISGAIRAATAQLADDLDKRKTIVIYCA